MASRTGSDVEGEAAAAPADEVETSRVGPSRGRRRSARRVQPEAPAAPETPRRRSTRSSTVARRKASKRKQPAREGEVEEEEDAGQALAAESSKKKTKKAAARRKGEAASTTPKKRLKQEAEAPPPPATDCSICMEPVGAEGGFTKLTCGHSFHVCCFANSVNAQTGELSPKCPNCRAVEPGEWKRFAHNGQRVNIQPMLRMAMGMMRGERPHEHFEDDEYDEDDEEHDEGHHHCPVCGMCIHSEEEVADHFVERHKSSCSTCFLDHGYHRSFDSEAQRLMHQWQEHDSAHLHCPLCEGDNSLCTDTWRVLEEHWSERHDLACWTCFSVLNKVTSFANEAEKGAHRCA